MAQPAPAWPKINTKPTQAWNASSPGVSVARRGGAPAYAARPASPPAAGP